jgi:rifampin ADP-ribosylating transferase
LKFEVDVNFKLFNFKLQTANMEFDPENAVVKLCVEGMYKEGGGDLASARALFEQAWYAATDDFESFVAAHYLARHQHSEEEALTWNLRALEHLARVATPGKEKYYSSLHLNAGHSYEKLRQPESSRYHYARADEFCSYLDAGPYGDMIRSGIKAALERTQA